MSEEYGPQTPEGKAFIEDLKAYMLDFPDLNELTGEQETKMSSLLLSVRMMLSDVHSAPPLIGKFSLKRLLGYSLLSPMLKSCAGHILDMKVQWMERNELQYSDGTKTAAINDKAKTYRQTANLLKSEAMAAFSNWKMGYNIRSGFCGGSGVGSVYSHSDFVI